jgi:hypothetical protein
MFARITLFVILGLKLSCDQQEQAKSQTSAPIARVKNHYLYKQDLENIKVDLNNSQDTVGLVDRYVQSWVTKQVLIAKAEEQGEYKKSDIERKILDYKYALIVHSYIEKLVNAKLDTKIIAEEVNNYYQEYRENFALKHPIVKGKFIIVPKEAPNKSSLRKLLASKQEADMTYLKEYCLEFAKDYSLDDTIWLNWNEVITKTPFGKIKDKTRLLKQTNLTEIQDESHYYYLKIDAYKVVGDTSPLELVEGQIKDVILYKRKLALANQIKEDILQQAKANKEFKIYDY